MTDNHHLEKSKNRNISATDRPLMKFSRITHNGSLKRIGRIYIFENPRRQLPPF